MGHDHMAMVHDDHVTALDDAAREEHQELMRLAVSELMQQYGWDERTAASVMLTVTTAVALAPKR